MYGLLPPTLHNELIIGCNGCNTAKNKQLFHSRTFSAKDAEQLHTWIASQGIPYIIDSASHYSLSPLPHHFHQEVGGEDGIPTEADDVMQEGLSKILVLR